MSAKFLPFPPIIGVFHCGPDRGLVAVGRAEISGDMIKPTARLTGVAP